MATLGGWQDYVAKAMTEKYVSPPVLQYSAVYAQSSSTSPVVFILSPGADPAYNLSELVLFLATPRSLPTANAEDPCRPEGA